MSCGYLWAQGQKERMCHKHLSVWVVLKCFHFQSKEHLNWRKISAIYCSCTYTVCCILRGFTHFLKMSLLESGCTKSHALMFFWIHGFKVNYSPIIDIMIATSTLYTVFDLYLPVFILSYLLLNMWHLRVVSICPFNSQDKSNNIFLKMWSLWTQAFFLIAQSEIMPFDPNSINHRLLIT